MAVDGIFAVTEVCGKLGLILAMQDSAGQAVGGIHRNHVLARRRTADMHPAPRYHPTAEGNAYSAIGK